MIPHPKYAKSGRKGGKAKSEAKAAAARLNGAKGGRPPKTYPRLPVTDNPRTGRKTITPS
jgi:hypothetical protein